jgi:hypothetical protein
MPLLRLVGFILGTFKLLNYLFSAMEIAAGGSLIALSGIKNSIGGRRVEKG